MKYIIGVGTNIGDRKENIENAVESLSLLPKTSVIRRSSFYETEPVGYADQQDFYNIVAEIDSSLEPNEILGACLGIEAGFGRVRTIKNGPRILDLDLILAENISTETANLSLPHPRYHERRFVLEPLLELFPDGVVYNQNILPFFMEIKGQRIKKISE